MIHDNKNNLTRVLIIEDEPAASARLSKLLAEMDPSLVISAVLESVEDMEKWFEQNKEPDLIIADIQLSDGLSIDYFLKHQPECPVIFTTAYQEYAIEAFKINSLDYLLKPIRPEALSRSIRKYCKNREHREKLSADTLKSLLKQMKELKSYKTRFLVKFKQSLVTVFVEDVRYFQVEDEMTFLITREGKKYPLEQTLAEIEELLDPQNFFRISRQRIISVKSVKSVHPYINNRLLLELDPSCPEEVLVSREKTGDFKKWLENT